MTLSEAIESDIFHAVPGYNGSTYVPFGDDLQMVFGRGINVCKYCIHVILRTVMRRR